MQDSTIVRLHSSLADKFPAARSRTVVAGIKVGVMVSAVANGPRTVALYSEKTAEIKTLKIGPRIKDRILLVDLGFYKTQMFARVEENGGYFVSRIRKNMDPIVLFQSMKEYQKQSAKISWRKLVVNASNNLLENILI
ncbi:transposase [Methanosarcina barkeri]|uniref:transposase n=1 Tax=Methanosarcina barkeri TaxID=2208 RepID=UPI0022A86278|nr:transposase [Methanosarcina barkeri]